MTQTPTAHTPAQGQARVQFTVPAQHPMVTVLGSGDSLLRVIEKAFPGPTSTSGAMRSARSATPRTWP